MQYIIAGLGNPGEEYENTRHNIGRMVVEDVARVLGASDWRDDKKLRAKLTQASAGTDKVTLVLPDNYMNRSGGSLSPLITSAKAAERLIVVHDDIDLPLGTLRIVFDRGAGGHNGVLSIERSIKTRAFMRVRVGVVPTTPTGKPKKPKGEQAVYDFILKQISKKDRERIDEVVARASKAVVTILEKGKEAAMQEFN
jgi:PTH1 family peptidyl-tRNA hydrolase